MSSSKRYSAGGSSGLKLPFLDPCSSMKSRSSSAVDVRIKNEGFDCLIGADFSQSFEAKSFGSEQKLAKEGKKYCSSSELLKNDPMQPTGTVSGYGDFLGQELNKHTADRIPLQRPKSSDNVLPRQTMDGSDIRKNNHA